MLSVPSVNQCDLIFFFFLLQEKKISVVTEPDSPHAKHEFVRKAFIKHDEVSS